MNITKTKRKKRRKQEEKKRRNIQYILLSNEGRELEEGQKFQY
jgi:hypothetical protein